MFSVYILQKTVHDLVTDVSILGGATNLFSTANGSNVAAAQIYTQL